MSARRGSARQAWVALRALLLMTVALGIVFPLAITAIAQLAFPAQANGSLVRSDGRVVGSALIEQSFTTAKGVALPQWFQSRPSAAGAGYDGRASGGSNAGPESHSLLTAIAARRAAIEKSDGVTADRIPADALTASASGLDPDISPAYALLQVPRVAAARGLSESAVRALVESRIQGRELGYLGEPVVNVLELNIALAALK
ncbi:potassium-transporting ATPase subunit KdpC [Galbitalea soli]|uniref:Potassium-transporting ATPase KdpC subunit n=1 Tax=Galbitalea soli TaxID=1268042 RepID=A0A7C9TPT3_9MICO|nr:potassium-transporting ATPase subunit KdpC [Galbitalea soli]NEM90300.1 potassium-transporting ATPase subunit KdpC [Galbitalea soli]NYJ31008.1 K+-transporting ATPase ATPase C chain [Galbitalea soli]